MSIHSYLSEWGGQERTAGGGNQIGVRSWRIGALTPRPRELCAAVLRFMHDLYAASRDNVQLAILDGREALILERI
jgi:DNA-binding IclR family transcriptional regulator